MSSYNPIASALNAAWSELSSDEAKVFYVQRSLENTFALIRCCLSPCPCSLCSGCSSLELN